MHQSEHGLSATIYHHPSEPIAVTGPSPYAEVTEPLPAYCGIYRAPTGWWGIVVHLPRGTHPQDAVQHFETSPTPVIWCSPNATIGLFRLPNRQYVVSARIPDSGLRQMKAIIAGDGDMDFAESRFAKRRVPAGIRYLPGKQMQLWFAL